MAQQQAMHQFVLGTKELEGKIAEFGYDKGWYSITDIVGEERTEIYRSRNAQEAYMKWNVYIGRKKERLIQEEHRRNEHREGNDRSGERSRGSHSNRNNRDGRDNRGSTEGNREGHSEDRLENRNNRNRDRDRNRNRQNRDDSRKDRNNREEQGGREIRRDRRRNRSDRSRRDRESAMQKNYSPNTFL